MRATNYKHYGNESKSKGRTSKSDKPKTNKKLKALSFVFAITLSAAALILPTTTLAPDVDAFEDSKATSYSIGDANEFAAVIIDNCAVETTAPLTQEETTVEPTTKKAVEEIKPEETSSKAETKAAKAEKKEVESENTESVNNTEASETSTNESNTDTNTEIIEETTDAVNNSNSSSGSYLISISNPDYSYNPSAVSLSSYDRAKLERLVMGEAGSMGYNGCALVAQCIRDAMNRSNTTSIDRIISEYQYYAPTNKEPNQTVKNAVSYIFDQNGSAVQHRILCFYTGSSGWHETQNFIVGCGNVRFFDLR